ncbi:MAG: hypothetical protein ACFFCX_02030 [Candidatus Sifarchaeia archaeon]
MIPKQRKSDNDSDSFDSSLNESPEEALYKSQARSDLTFVEQGYRISSSMDSFSLPFTVSSNSSFSIYDLLPLMCFDDELTEYYMKMSGCSDLEVRCNLTKEFAMILFFEPQLEIASDVLGAHEAKRILKAKAANGTYRSTPDYVVLDDDEVFLFELKHWPSKEKIAWYNFEDKILKKFKSYESDNNLINTTRVAVLAGIPPTAELEGLLIDNNITGIFIDAHEHDFFSVGEGQFIRVQLERIFQGIEEPFMCVYADSELNGSTSAQRLKSNQVRATYDD